MRWLAAFLLLGLNGCAFLSGAVNESRTNSKLGRYLRYQTYPLSREEIGIRVEEALRENRAWHRERNAIVALGDWLGAQPVRYEGVREIYYVSSDESGTRVAIRNKGDGDRLFHQELDLFERIYPEEGRALRARIERENPGIKLHPWD